jgi:hypothetical protein
MFLAGLMLSFLLGGIFVFFIGVVVAVVIHDGFGKILMWVGGISTMLGIGIMFAGAIIAAFKGTLV